MYDADVRAAVTAIWQLAGPDLGAMVARLRRLCAMTDAALAAVFTARLDAECAATPRRAMLGAELRASVALGRAVGAAAEAPRAVLVLVLCAPFAPILGSMALFGNADVAARSVPLAAALIGAVLAYGAAHHPAPPAAFVAAYSFSRRVLAVDCPDLPA
jgi:hypothetical protein